MKIFCLIAMMAAAAGAAALAQSNTNAPPQLLRVTDIHSHSAVFDGNGHTVTYRGDVRVIAPDMKLTCALLVADLPPSGGRVSHIVAETNVVMDAVDSKGQPIHATSQMAVYDYSVQNGTTNEIVTLTGIPQPQIVISQGTNTADKIIWDRANNGYSCQGNYSFQPESEQRTGGHQRSGGGDK
jgi:lipopolysaccharide export system protein LptA